MQELQSLQMAELMDLLAEYTAKHTKLFAEKNLGDEYEKIKLTIKALQEEIDSRKHNDSTHMTPPPDFVQ